jgi:hypothetical protein
MTFKKGRKIRMDRTIFSDEFSSQLAEKLCKSWQHCVVLSVHCIQQWPTVNCGRSVVVKWIIHKNDKGPMQAVIILELGAATQGLEARNFTWRSIRHVTSQRNNFNNFLLPVHLTLLYLRPPTCPFLSVTYCSGSEPLILRWLTRWPN